ncbi:MAG: rhodanese-like domain-containing protein [Acidobacteriota bacterium]
MPVKQITPPQVNSLLDAQERTVYLDVRSIDEFDRGHVPGALNIPLLHLAPGTRQMVPNADFLPVVEAVLAKDARVICGCAAGGRSSQAAQILLQAGYTDVQNMEGGFSGARDPMGHLIAKGWTDHELPVSNDSNDSTSYEALARRRARR